MASGKLWSEFKAFAFKGNMIDLAVAVVIGGAFSTVITSLVKDVIMPSISYVTSAAAQAKETVEKVAVNASHSVGLTTPATLPATQASSQPTTLPATAPVVIAGPPPVVAAPAPPPPAPAPPPAEAKEASSDKAVDIDLKLGRINLGGFIASLINFVLVAFAVFIMIVKALGSVMKKVGGTPSPSEPTTKECGECLSIIPIKARRCAYCTAVQPPLPYNPTAG